MKILIKNLILSGAILVSSYTMAQSSMTSPPSPNTQSGEITQPILTGKPRSVSGASGSSQTGNESLNTKHLDTEAEDTKGAVGSGKKNMNTKDPKFNGSRVKGAPLNGTNDTIPQ